MLLGRLGLETARQPHADRHGCLYLDRGRLEVEDGCIRFATAGGALESGDWQIPHQSLSIILLGPGSSVTHDALRILARHGVALAAVGTDGVRFYTAPPLLPDQSAYARRQAELWGRPQSRIAVARRMYGLRLGEVLPHRDIAVLRGIEGARVKESYRLTASRSGVPWNGRRYDRANPAGADMANQAINHAASAVEAAAAVAVAATATIPQLGFIHEDSGQSFVLDVADLAREQATLPIAFGAAKEALRTGENVERLVRRKAGRLFSDTGLIPLLIDRIKTVLQIEDGSRGAEVRSEEAGAAKRAVAAAGSPPPHPAGRSTTQEEPAAVEHPTEQAGTAGPMTGMAPGGERDQAAPAVSPVIPGGLMDGGSAATSLAHGNPAPERIPEIAPPATEPTETTPAATVLQPGWGEAPEDGRAEPGRASGLAQRGDVDVAAAPPGGAAESGPAAPLRALDRPAETKPATTGLQTAEQEALEDGRAGPGRGSGLAQLGELNRAATPPGGAAESGRAALPAAALLAAALLAEDRLAAPGPPAGLPPADQREAEPGEQGRGEDRLSTDETPEPRQDATVAPEPGRGLTGGPVADERPGAASEQDPPRRDAVRSVSTQGDRSP